MAQMVNYNKIILGNYQGRFPNLAHFSYDEENDALMYNGDKIFLNGYGLSRIDQIFFQLNSDDIYRFFKFGFFYESNEIGKVRGLLFQPNITEEQIRFLENYSYRLNERIGIYARNNELFTNFMDKNPNIHLFALEIVNGRRLIEEARVTPNKNSASTTLVNAYDATNNQNYNSEVQSKGVSLTREKGGIPSLYPNYDDQKIGIAGFTSIVLILIYAICFGVFLAVKFMP